MCIEYVYIYVYMYISYSRIIYRRHIVGDSM